MKPLIAPKKGIGKAIVFALFLAAMITLFRFTPVRQYISPDYLRGLVNSFGPWGPLVFVLLYAGGICLFLLLKYCKQPFLVLGQFRHLTPQSCP